MLYINLLKSGGMFSFRFFVVCSTVAHKNIMQTSKKGECRYGTPLYLNLMLIARF